MASRIAVQAVPYNPSQWGPINPGTSRLGAGQNIPIRQATSSDDVVASPPPPYSPRHSNTFSATNSTVTPSATSPSETNSTVMDRSQYASPLNVSTTISPAIPPAVQFARSHATTSMPASEASSSAWQSGVASQGQGSRSSSHLSANRSYHAQHPVQGGEHSRTASHGRMNDQILFGSLINSSGDYLANFRPPASKRATSANASYSTGGSSQGASRTASVSPSRNGSWSHGMPLPGPPPGLPPSASRSQSASGVGLGAKQLVSPAQHPKSRSTVTSGTHLEPIPPTPAGWADEGQQPGPGKLPVPLQIDTSVSSAKPVVQVQVAAEDSSLDTQRSTSVPPSGTGLFRSAAVRDTSAKGLRERRTMGRHSNEPNATELSSLSISSNHWIDAREAVRPTSSHGRKVAALQDESSGLNPHPRSSVSESTVGSVLSAVSKTSTFSPTSLSTHSTPRQTPGLPRSSLGRLTQTPPFSPSNDRSPVVYYDSRSGLPPKALPTPPLNISRKSLTERPSANVVSIPNESPVATGLPSTPRLSVVTSAKSTGDGYQERHMFIAESMKRHELFLVQERDARNDEERLRLFADYILAESRLRRRRYSNAWATGNFDVRPVREKLFEQSLNTPRRSSGLSETVLASPDESTPPASGSESQTRPESTWWNNYQPILSPIASMSMNDDEMSSRGRTPSRWWESNPGSDSNGRAPKIERSKRESKYMGLPRETREAMRLGIAEVDSPGLYANGDSEGVHGFPAEKANPDTFGYYDEPQPSPYSPTLSKMPQGPTRLDISRFITLPPPYPRHHPAVNNSHPDLAEYRTAIRILTESSDIKARKARFKTSMEAFRRDSEQKLMENRRNFRSNVHVQVEEGSLSYADAAEAEQAFKLDEDRLEKRRIQEEFDSFQDVVLNPLHDMLNGRVVETDALIQSLQHKLMADAQVLNIDQTQEEGDEQPELLEKLTQLKWLFEAREYLHREIFELLTNRNDMYKAIVILPYRQAGNEDKARDTEAFFAQDSHDRSTEFEKQSLERHQAFLEVIQDNVARGLDLQSSAFWDIAPSLVEILQKIPENLRDFEGIQIPAQEYEENASYYTFPLQYLYSVLTHTERSTYQFIESQTNLLCLLHEAKTGVLTSRGKVMEVQGNSEGGATSVQTQHEVVERMKAREEQMMNDDLKDKVAMIEEQWLGSLGRQLDETKTRVKAWLVEEGGWEGMDDEICG